MILAAGLRLLPVPLASRTWSYRREFAAEVREPEPPRPPRVPRGEEYQAMLDAEPGLTRAGLARRLGVSRAAITQALRAVTTRPDGRG